MKATAIVLAGQREGSHDSLAAAAGVPSKALVPLAGEAMIVHVLRSLLASDHVGEVRIVCGDEDHVRRCLASVMPSCVERVRFVPAAVDLVDSVLAAAEGASFPLLVTTADNVLLTRHSVDEFIEGARAKASNGAVLAMAQKRNVLAAHPTGQRKFYRFTEGEFSNCNTYWIGSGRALRAVESFRSGGQFVKYPVRIAQEFGIFNLVRFGLGIGSLEMFLARLSRRFGVPVRHVELSDGACAVDVDNERSFVVAQRILAMRSCEPAAA